jgi:hypothetical protein
MLASGVDKKTHAGINEWQRMFFSFVSEVSPLLISHVPRTEYKRFSARFGKDADTF